MRLKGNNPTEEERQQNLFARLRMAFEMNEVFGEDESSDMTFQLMAHVFHLGKVLEEQRLAFFTAFTAGGQKAQHGEVKELLFDGFVLGSLDWRNVSSKNEYLDCFLKEIKRRGYSFIEDSSLVIR